MVKYQYEFPLDKTGKAGAVKPYRGEKNDFVTPVSNLSGVAEILTNAALKATEAYSQLGQDRLGAVLVSKVKGWAYADREGTLFIEESENNNVWTTTAAMNVAAGVLTATDWVYLSKRYYRFRYVNGNLQQSEFVLYQSVGAGEMDVRVNEKAPLQIDLSEIQTGDGRLKVKASQTFDFVFHENAESAGEGAALPVNGAEHLLVEVYGTAEMSEVKFWGKSVSGQKIPISGVKSDDATSGSSTLGKAEAWAFNIKGFKEIIMEIASISGGTLSVKGTAVL
ncbi:MULTISPECIES: phage-like element PBSX protein XepA [unclassified Bacillus (in: firmicutes)]|uniref:phage-like element PBSX protein XepA n=1 Tax=unclassified Bacillus (in: firmicutes) TaxID=185979 RepID=UPI00227E4422|nr:phage portal protein [Bacillus sp. S20C3]MCY8288115.1 phage portal protein [Bacillus sp. N13C7]MCY8636907.1 phage portal protein [Bacillus sp. S17B2]MCY9143196.1 phage portal protein [Bacillus sp. T9C1]